jgi:hypothetical protein
MHTEIGDGSEARTVKTAPEARPRRGGRRRAGNSGEPEPEYADDSASVVRAVKKRRVGISASADEAQVATTAVVKPTGLRGLVSSVLSVFQRSDEAEV